MRTTLSTLLPKGEYCNRLAKGACEAVMVDDDGNISIQLGPMSALAVDLGFTY